jgi:anti-sigma regulatory factor (Ser/Thr protein kinase)
MPGRDSSSNGGGPSATSGRRATSEASGLIAGIDQRDATIERLKAVIDQLRRGAAALKSDNRHLRAEVARRERQVSGRHAGDAPNGESAQLTEIELPINPRAPGAARIVVDHCLMGLVTRRVLDEVQLLATELVTNSLDHGQLGNDGFVLLRVSLATGTLRIEIENAGTAGVVARRLPDIHASPGGFGLYLVDRLAVRWGVDRRLNTSVWFEMARA